MIRGLPFADLSPNLANKSHISLQKKWLGPLFFEKCGNQWFRPRVSGVNVMQWRRTFEWIFYGRIHYWTWTDLSSEFECNGIDYLGKKWTAEREERGLCYKMQLFQLADQKSNEWAAGWHLSTVGNPSCISRNPIHFFFPLSGAEQESIPTVAEPVRRMSFPEENVTIKRLPIWFWSATDTTCICFLFLIPSMEF